MVYIPPAKKEKTQHRDKTDPMVCCELFLTHSEKSQNIELRRKYNAECSKTDGQTPPSYRKTKKKVDGNLPSKQLICSSRTSGRCLAWSLAIMVSTLLLFATIWNPCLFVSICFRSDFDSILAGVCGYVAAAETWAWTQSCEKRW